MVNFQERSAQNRKDFPGMTSKSRHKYAMAQSSFLTSENKDFEAHVHYDI